LDKIGQIGRNLGKIEAKFGQNQNLASSKTFELLRPCIHGRVVSGRKFRPETAQT